MHRALTVVFLLNLLYNPGVSQGDVPKYLSGHQRREALESLRSSFPTLARIEVVGQTNGSQVYAFIVSNLSRHEFLRPRVHLLADFPAGLELLLMLASYLLREFGRDENVTDVVSRTEVHLLFYPSATPVGAGSTAGARSTVDCAQDGKLRELNGFPDFFSDQGVKTTDDSKLENRVRFIAEWLKRGKYVLGAHLQGGRRDLVAAYGFHNSAKDENVTRTPDDDVLRHLSKTYASHHPRITKGTPQCPGGHLGGFPEGITPAAAWKRRAGLLEDFAYAKEGVLETALAVSCCAVPAETSLRELWEENRKPLLMFLREAQRGIRGYVKEPRGAHIPGALLTIRGRNVAFRSSDMGEFWRILLPGDYTLLVMASGYLPTAVRTTVSNVTAESSTPVVITLMPSFEPVVLLPIDGYTTSETTPRRRSDTSKDDTVHAAGFELLHILAVVGAGALLSKLNTS